MTKRMWAAADGKLAIEGKRGSFDIAYGNASELQKLDIWLPDTEQEKVPFIFIIHGGGFMALDKRDCEMAHAIKETIKRGFAAVSLNYRMTQEVKFPEPIRDIKQAIRFIKKHGAEYQLDTEKMMVWGGSAGGYLTLMAALFIMRPISIIRMMKMWMCNSKSMGLSPGIQLLNLQPWIISCKRIV